jgi:hypothetical protein
MRWSNFVEGLFFMVGFLVVCLVVLTSRPLQPAPARRTVRAYSHREVRGRLNL